MGLKAFACAGSALLVAVGLAVSAPALAHHSFAKWDMSDEALVKFTGKVTMLDFKNPHMSMDMEVPGENGGTRIIHFSEGGPRNMLIRMGIRDEDIAEGKTITVYGSPHRDDPSQFFAKRFEFADGRVIDVMGGAR